MSAGSGPPLREPFAIYDPDSCSWRTSQPSLFEDLQASPPTWPKSGTWDLGAAYEHPMSVPATAGSASSSSPGLLKTPTAQLAVNGGSQHPDKRRAGGHGPTLADQVECELLPTPAARDWKSGQSNLIGTNARPLNEVVEMLLPTLRATDGSKWGPSQSSAGGDSLPTAIVDLLPTLRASDTGTPGRRASEGWAGAALASSPADPHGDGLAWLPECDGEPESVSRPRTTTGGPSPMCSGLGNLRRRHPAAGKPILGRPAPRPTEPGRTGERLSPRFVEWMMGLPEGWVTDVPGLSRNAQLKALGNGVVPQQAAMALRLLLDRSGPIPLLAEETAA